MLHTTHSFALYDEDGKQLINLSEMILDDNYQATAHTHHMLEISCIKDGTGIYFIDSQQYNLSQGDIVIIGNKESHLLQVEKNSLLTNLVIHFEPEYIWNTLKYDINYDFLRIFYERTPSFTHRLNRKDSATSQIYNLFLEIEQEFIRQEISYELMVKAKLMTIFAMIMRQLGSDFSVHASTCNPQPDRNVQEMNQAMQYIHAHFTDEITLEELADIACMSPTYFSANFKKLNGLSPFSYISSLRVQMALELIKTSHKNLTEIASDCGFHSSANFNKIFKRITGNSPSFYR